MDEFWEVGLGGLFMGAHTALIGGALLWLADDPGEPIAAWLMIGIGLVILTVMGIAGLGSLAGRAR